MAIDRDAVRKIAHLARLELSEAEIELYQAQLGGILDHIEKLRELNVEGVEPLAHAAALATVHREDEPRPGLSTEDALSNAPEKIGPYFVVPRILDAP
ncbi:MAG: Asp-tRNA(Asn)/Glu-tRNA(Gln) amidotransferase subunit GatC [Planctomycetes bacterium]|nr:Asp-tRNA(Asn)/Glu-tRNA(Gln) amidotransferase subunit GatC [Planctomycetota bacterium]